MKNALVLSCSTGGGHNSCAHAVMKNLEKDGWKAELLDPFSLDSQKTAYWVGHAYVDLIQVSPKGFFGLYKAGELYEKLEKKLPIPSPVFEAQKHTTRKLKKYLDENPVDMIVCTHMYPGMMIAYLKDQGVLLPPSIMVTTDYACIPFESEARCDYVTAASADIVPDFLNHGVDSETLLPFGIPVDPRFEEPVTKEEARRKLNIPRDRTMLLMGSGSMGFLKVSSQTRALNAFLKAHPECDLYILCGQSREMLEHVESMNNPRIHGIPFTDNVCDYVHSADIYMTKPGGLSITEAASAGTPLLLFSPIPGVETLNAEYFEKKGMAFYARTAKEIEPFLEQLLNPAIADKIVEAQKNVLPKNSGKNISRFMEDRAKQDQIRRIEPVIEENRTVVSGPSGI